MSSGEPINLARLSYEDLRRRSDVFLSQHHPLQNIPIPIEEIAELQLRMDIVPTPGLQRSFEIDSFVANDLSAIYVDEFVYESRPARYRFSLAHELAHVVLHSEVFRSLNFSTVATWKATLRSIPEGDYGWMEWQANAFAGLVLVPAQVLADRFAAVTQLVEAQGVSLASASDVAREMIDDHLGREFGVSGTVIEKRAAKDRLWPGSPA